MTTYGAELWIYYGCNKEMLATKITLVSLIFLIMDLLMIV